MDDGAKQFQANRAPATTRGADRYITLTTSPASVSTGIKTKAQARRLEKCGACMGTDVASHSSDTSCKNCKGQRRVEVLRTIEVNIPPGIQPGTRLCLPGHGDEAIGDGPPGDLYMVIQPYRHEKSRVGVTLIKVLGALVFLLGIFLYAGNTIGFFPTFPFLGFIVMAIGGILFKLDD
ncbi:MAG: hypothetical protein ICV60_02690 [Pyrinomonadaceae bacterium]|nr:hypothetical protein [Pyrinomonadaceae bacterium]